MALYEPGSAMDEAERFRAEALRILRTIEPRSVCARSTEVRQRAMELIARANKLRRTSQLTAGQLTHQSLRVVK